MNRKKWMIFFVCAVAIAGGGIIAMRMQPKQTKKITSDQSRKSVEENKKAEEQSRRQREGNYIDNKMEAVQTGYFTSLKKGGTIEQVTYTTRDYTGEMTKYKKDTWVYLPYGYDAEEKDTKYEIVYLMHGGGDDEKWYFGDGGYESDLKCILDHMIANGDMPPCIVCAPTYQNPYCANESESIKYFAQEFEKDLIPVVEGKYHTYYDSVSAKNSRWHRAFGGFSMGAAATWWIFEKCMDSVACYMPISGESWCGGSNGKEKVEHLSKAVRRQGYSAKDFLLFYGSGDVGDIAYHGVTAQVKAMKSDNGIFQYCDNFANGNFYYEKIKDGGHDINTVNEVVYNGLQRLFSK